MNREALPALPSDAPRSFVKQTWAPFVFTGKGLDRWPELDAFTSYRYEAVTAELRRIGEDRKSLNQRNLISCYYFDDFGC